jgi:hypothetical protein
MINGIVMDKNNGLYFFIMDKNNGIYFMILSILKKINWDLFYGIYFMIMGTFFFGDFYKYVIMASSFFSTNLFHGLILINGTCKRLDDPFGLIMGQFH